MRIKPKDLLLPLVVLAPMAMGVHNLTLIVGSSGRWVMLFVLATYLMLVGARRRGRGLSAAMTLSLSAYIGWCMLTASWSEVPLLAALKSIALGLALLVAVTGGVHWVTQHPSSK